ncbi:MAG: hypothetical protein ACRDGV_12860 [Candidatus Limnocylindria bacterium]
MREPRMSLNHFLLADATHADRLRTADEARARRALRRALECCRRSLLSLLGIQRRGTPCGAAC